MKDMLANPMMRKLTTFFLFAIIADGLLEVAVILTGSLFPGPRVLAFISSISSFGVLLFGLVLFLGMMITPRLSKRILLLPMLFQVFAFGCLIFCHPGRMKFLFPLAEVLLGLGLFVWYRGRTTASLWSIQKTCDARPLFTLRNFLLTGLLNGTIACFALLLCVLGMTRFVFDDVYKSGGYFTHERGGIWTDERVFRKGDQEIRLIGMTHSAPRAFYDELEKSLPNESRSILLLEGVNDRDHRLKEVIGPTPQQDSSFPKNAAESMKESKEDRSDKESHKSLEYKIADVDSADFKPETIRFMQAQKKARSCGSLKRLLQFIFSPEGMDLDLEDVANIDILELRNKHLIDEIGASLKTYSTVVVPWGAAHMPAIQTQIEKWGFVETNRTRHVVVSFENQTISPAYSLFFKLHSAFSPVNKALRTIIR